MLTNKMNNKKLTVVEWLQETLRYNSVNIFKGSIEDQAKNLEQVFKQAKEMEYNIFFHWYFTGKNDKIENKSFRQRYNEKYGPNLEENKTNNMKLYRHKLTKAIMSEHDYNHLSSYEQSQMEVTDRVTVAELDQMSRNKSYWVSTPSDEGKKMTGENNNPDNTGKEKTSKQNNTGKYPVPGQIWKHYKGGQYEIIAMCNHTDTDESLVG
jgi:putative lipase involved disintegration of autophagic bodies